MNKSRRRCRGFSLKADWKNAGVYSTLKKAEKAVAKCVEDFKACSDWTPDILGFYVREFRVDRMLYEKDMWNDVYEREWSYTKDGKPFSYSPFSSDWLDGAYSGTPAGAIRFRVGDYVWVHMSGKFIPAKVVYLPYTQEEWKKKFKFASDASDDCYTVVMEDGHYHPRMCSLFPMDEEIPGKIMALIEDREKKYLNGESL